MKTTKTFKIKGMHCASCALTIEKAAVKVISYELLIPEEIEARKWPFPV